jgi:RimJ/RimL family protein N-acetyltransferase
MLQGILVDLVPHGERFTAHETEWVNGPMREWWGMDGLRSEASMRARRESRQPEAEAGQRIQFGILNKQDIPIGTFVLRDIDPYHRLAEVGAGIGDLAYWGGGYGSDAMLLIVEYGFEWLNLRRLFLTTRGDNLRAQHQVEKCGFTREGMRRLARRNGSGEWVDFLIYGLLRDEWPGREVMVERLGLRDRAGAQSQER